MSEAAQTQLAEIESLTKPQPAPVPKPARKPAPVPAPVPVGELEDEDEDDALPDLGFPARPCRSPLVGAAPVAAVDPGPVVYREDGFPCIASDGEVKAATENVGQLRARLVDARAAEAQAAVKLGVGAGQYDHNRTEKLAAVFIERGGSEDDVEAYHSAGRKLRRLEEAVRLAEAKMQPARERAMRRLYDRAQERLKPSFVTMQRALLAASKAVCDHVAQIDAAERAGFPACNEYNLFSTQVPRNHAAARAFFAEQVARGILDAADLDALK
jgi:hypothetical protein